MNKLIFYCLLCITIFPNHMEWRAVSLRQLEASCRGRWKASCSRVEAKWVPVTWHNKWVPPPVHPSVGWDRIATAIAGALTVLLAWHRRTVKYIGEKYVPVSHGNYIQSGTCIAARDALLDALWVSINSDKLPTSLNRFSYKPVY